ncbi:MAG: hypothetical protein AAGF36_05560 [Pseudomonadota bacterium]
MRLFELIRQERIAFSAPKSSRRADLSEAEQAGAFQQLALRSFR